MTDPDSADERRGTDGDSGEWSDAQENERSGADEANRSSVGEDQRPNETLADRTAFQRDVLWTLANHGPAKGVALQRRLAAYYEGEVHHSRVYTNLDDLVADGLITKGARDRRTNEYRLTATGRRALSRRRAWTAGIGSAVDDGATE